MSKENPLVVRKSRVPIVFPKKDQLFLTSDSIKDKNPERVTVIKSKSKINTDIGNKQYSSSVFERDYTGSKNQKPESEKKLKSFLFNFSLNSFA